MIGKNYYFQLIIRVCAIVVIAFAFAYTLLHNQIYVAVALAVFLIIQVVFLIKYLNKTNLKIAYFFESLKNEDFTLRFSEDANPKSLKQLHRSLNEVNSLIRDTQLKNKSQENYYQEILRQAKIGILTINNRGHILFSNPTAKRLLNCVQLNHLRQLERVDKELFKLLSVLKPFERRLFQFTNERETIQLLIKSTEVVLSDDVLKLVTIQDINTAAPNSAILRLKFLRA